RGAGDAPLQSHGGGPAGALAPARGRVSRRHPRLRPSDRQWLLGAPEERRRPVNRERRDEQRAGHPAWRRDGIYIWNSGAFSRTDRSQDGGSRAERLAPERGTNLLEQRPAERAQRVSSQDGPDPRAGPRKLCDSRVGAVLGSSFVYRDRRPLG